MSRLPQTSAILWAASALACAPAAQAQDDVGTLRAELNAMRDQMDALNARIDDLQDRLADAEAEGAAAQAQAELATLIAEENLAQARQSTAAQAERETAATEVLWRGAPQIEGEGGWSFKPRGRIQYDAAYVAAPERVSEPGLGFSNEARRVRLGAAGSVPGGFGYKIEVDVAGEELQVVDAIVSYETGDLAVQVGQHNPFQGLEELSSSLFTSFIERAAYTDAFGFIRRVGISAQYQKDDLLLQGGLFTDNMEALNDDGNDSQGVDGRIVYMPVIGGTQLHLGGSAHYRDLGNTIDTVRYRQRPLVRSTDVRFVNTGAVTASAETGLGLEAAAIMGRFHVAGETFWQIVSRPGLADPTFFGGAIEAGYFLTPGDRRGYEAGVFERVVPAHGLNEGGIGAWQINARYDRLDLTDANVIGGTQDGYMLSLIWTPTAYTRLMANYARLQYDDAVIVAADGDGDYGVDVVAMRAQIDF